MGVKDILAKVISRDSTESANYLSVTLTSDKILATIWRLSGENQVDFVGYSEKQFHSVDGLIHEAAAAIDSAAKNITSDVNQVVFGLSNYWFEDGRLAQETSEILKNMAKELELDAQAFVPLAASISHYQTLKGEGKNSMYIGAFSTYTEISLVKEGSATSTEHKGKATTQDISRLINKLRKTPDEALPKQVIIFGDNAPGLLKEIDKESENNIFDKDTKVELMKNQELAACIAYSQAADVLGNEPQISASAAQLAPDATDAEEISPHEASAKQPTEMPPEHEQPDDGFEFQEGQDVLEKKATDSQEVKKQADDNEHQPPPADEYAVEMSEKPHVYETPAQKLHESKAEKKSPIESILTLNWLRSFSKGSKKKILIAIALLAAAALATLYVLGLTLTNAQVLIKASSQPLEDTFDVTVASGAALDIARSRIPGEEIIATAQDSSQGQPTGTKKTGNYAKGEVKVLNWTTAKVDFNSGTTIISKNGIKFELSSKVEIASRSASSPGESIVGVVAQEFGENGNLPPGTEFTFQQFDELLYSAKNDNAFAGGDEKEIRVVTKKDQDELAQTLEKSLTQKAKDELNQKTTEKEILDESIEIKVLKKQFDKQIDEEATVFTLNMEIEASALFHKEEVLKEFLSKISQDKVDDSLQSIPENIEVLNLDVTREKSTLRLKGKYRANLVPQIDVEALKTNIAGKSQKSAREQIKQNPKISDVEFIFSPNFIILSSIPKNKDKILIKIEAIK